MGLKAQNRLIAGAPDYESGSWTPTIAGATVAGTQTYAVQNGTYVKIGKVVLAWATIAMSAKDGATSGNLLIAGLPYPSGSGQASVTNIVAKVELPSGYSQFIIRVRGSGNNDAILGAIGDNVPSVSITAASLNSNSEFTTTLVYQTSA